MGHIRHEMTDPEVLKEVGRRLRALRKARKLTRAGVAERAGLGLSTVMRAERGDGPTVLTLVRLLRVYGRIQDLDQFIQEPTVSPLAVMARGTPEGRRGRPGSKGGQKGE